MLAAKQLPKLADFATNKKKDPKQRFAQNSILAHICNYGLFRSHLRSKHHCPHGPAPR